MLLGPNDAYRGPVISYQWRGDFASAEIEALHSDGCGHAPEGYTKTPTKASNRPDRLARTCPHGRRLHLS
jgi:hypothetical protein